jgi:hypothetical protein
VAARLARLVPVLVFGSVPGSVALKRVGVGVAVFHAVRVGRESADGSSAGSRTTAPGLGVGSVGGLRCVALLCAVSCESVLSTQVGPTVYGA